MKVFLVENDSVTGARLQDLLTGDGHVVEWAINGKCVEIKLPVSNPDVILLDFFLGDIDGLSLLKVVRTDPRIARIPVVLTTPAADDELPLNVPPDVRLLRKPFDYAELVAILAELVPAGAASVALAKSEAAVK